MSIELVVFDLGKVLLRICDGWEHACDVAGVPRPKSVNGIDPATRAEIDEIIGLYDTGKIDLPTFAEKISEHRGIEPAHVIALSDAYLLGPYPGVGELLHELRERKIATACLSNTTSAHWDKVFDPKDSNYLPMHLLMHLFASHLVGLRKPHEAIYKHVESATGVSGEQIVFFDDLEANILGAKKCGWNAHQIDIKGDPIVQARERLREHGVL